MPNQVCTPKKATLTQTRKRRDRLSIMGAQILGFFLNHYNRISIPKQGRSFFTGLLELGFQSGKELGEGGSIAEIVEPFVVCHFIEGGKRPSSESFLDESHRFVGSIEN